MATPSDIFDEIAAPKADIFDEVGGGDIFDSLEPATPKSLPERANEMLGGRLKPLQDIGRALVRGAGGAVQSIGGFVSGSPGMMPSVRVLPNAAKEEIYSEARDMGGAITKLGTDLASTVNAATASGSDLSNPEWWTQRLPEFIPQLGAQLGLGLLTKNPAVFAASGGAMMAGSAYNDAYSDRVAKGQDTLSAQEDAASEAAVVGAVGMALERLPGLQYLKSNTAVQNAIGKIVQNKFAKKMLAGGATESITEMAQEVSTGLAALGFRDDAERMASAIKQLPASGVMGLFGGAGAGALTAVGPAETDASVDALLEETAASKPPEPVPIIAPPTPAVEVIESKRSPQAEAPTPAVPPASPEPTLEETSTIVASQPTTEQPASEQSALSDLLSLIGQKPSAQPEAVSTQPSSVEQAAPSGRTVEEMQAKLAEAEEEFASNLDEGIPASQMRGLKSQITALREQLRKAGQPEAEKSERIRSKREQEDALSMGPGAASSEEALARYEERKFAKRMNADGTVSTELREESGENFYEPIPLNVSVEQANNLIETRGEDSIADEIQDKSNDLTFTDRTTVGQMLVTRLDERYKALKVTDPIAARAALDKGIALSEWLKTYGTELGRAVNAFKVWNDRLTLSGMMEGMLDSNGGVPLTPEQVSEVESQHEKLVETQTKLDKRTAELEEDAATDAAESAFKEFQSRVKSDIDPVVASIADRIIARLTSAADKARARLRARLGATTAGVDPTVLYDVSIIGAEWIAKGVRQKSKWLAKMLEDLGDSFRQYFEPAWEQSSKRVDDVIEQAAPKPKREKVKKALKSDTPADRFVKLTDAIKERISDGDSLRDLRPYVQRLAENFVRQGAKTVDGLVDALHKALEPLVPGITRRQTMDLMSGYGDFKELDKSDVKARLRDLKGQAQQLAKLEDITSKSPILKTGVERRTPTDSERRLIKEVNEAKRKYGVVTTDPAKQLKSAQEAIKTRIRNEIKDLAHEIETGEKPPDRTQIEHDDETDALRATLGRLRETLRALEDPKVKTEAERIKIAEDSLIKSIAEYDAKIRRGHTRTAKAPPLSTPRLEALRAQRDARRAELEALRAADSALQEERTFDRLMKQATDLEMALAMQGPAQPDAPKAPDSALVAEARERVRELRRQLATARASSPEAQKAKVEAALKSLQKSISDYDVRLQTGDLAARTSSSPSVTSPEIEARRAERDAMRTLLNDLRREARPKLSPDELALKMLKVRLASQTAKLQQRIATGNFAPPVRRTVDISKDPEAVRLRAENNRVRREYELAKFKNARATRGWVAKSVDAVKEILSVPRAVLSSLDVSAVLRQGGFITFGNPVRAARALGPMFRSLVSQRAFDKIQAEIESRPNAELYKSSKLYLAEVGDVKLSAKEEAMMSQFAEKIPFVKWSNRAYVAFLNKLRADSFDVMLATLKKGPTPTKEETNAIANYINIATGRGNLGTHGAAAETLSAVFFSPRLLVSRFQILGGVLSGFRFGGGSGRTRALIGLEYVKTLTGGAIIMALGALAGGELEEDPRSSDFGKIKFGNTRLDPLMGLSQVSVLLSRLISGETKTSKGKVQDIRGDKVKYGGATGADMAFRFLRTKFSPVLGEVFNLISGENVVGERVTPSTTAKNLLTPLSFREVSTIMEAHGVSRGAAITMLSLFGMGVQHYESRKRKIDAISTHPEA